MPSQQSDRMGDDQNQDRDRQADRQQNGQGRPDSLGGGVDTGQADYGSAGGQPPVDDDPRNGNPDAAV